jgi:hypothetical protein
MYQTPAALDYMAAYQRDEALRNAESRRLASEVDSHTSAQHGLIAAAIAVLLVLVLLAVL